MAVLIVFLKIWKSDHIWFIEYNSYIEEAVWLMDSSSQHYLFGIFW